MPIVRAKNFKGYSSKADDLIDHPEIGQDCANIIINKGDICNLPRAVSQIDTRNMPYLSTFYVAPDTWLLILLYDNGDIYAVEKGDDTLATGFLSGEDLLELWPHSFDPTNETIKYGNVFQFGDWLYIYANTSAYFEEPGPYTERFERMFRIKFEYDKSSDSIDIYSMLVGIRAPIELIFNGNPGTGITGTYSFAFSFVTNKGNIIILKDNTISLHPDDIESDPIIDTAEQSLSNQSIKYKIYFPKGETGPEPIPFLDNSVNGPGLIAAYAKTPEEQLFSFIGYFVYTSEPVFNTQKNLWCSEFIIDTVSQNTARILEIYGKKPPKVGLHNCYFKDRMYNSVIKAEYGLYYSDAYSQQFVKIKRNTLQVGRLFHDEFSASPFNISQHDLARLDAYRIPNYIELEESIGSDDYGITGLIEFLDQMIIFKENETHLLTDDIQIGQLIKIFDIGCVNTNGGRGYIVVNNILYWVAQDGVYAWDGGGNPLKISEPIQEDLSALDLKYAKLSADTKYGLVYLTFINDDSKGFVYHYNEEGAWTKLTNYLVYIETDPDGNVWFGYFSGTITKLGTIDDVGLATNEDEVPFWESGLLTLGDDVRKKQWKEFTLETQTKLDSSKTIDFVIKDEDGTEIVSTSSNTKKKMHLGIYKENLTIRINLNNFTVYPFRINGYSITAKPKGRR